MRGNLTIFSVLALSFVPAGCNTDPLWEPAQKAEGPTTQIDKPVGINLPDIHIADARETDLVEAVLTHRAQYVRSLRVLRDYYNEHGYNVKRQWAEQELADMRKVRPYRYIVSSEIPSDVLRPTDSVAAADAMYDRAMQLLKEGGYGVLGLYREGKMREAHVLFRDIVEQYPTSDKIDDAAFYCGEILKEYFKDQEQLAVKWYERAFTYDPKTPHPARFQAAVIYDIRMYDRDRALELYHAAIEHESWNDSNRKFSIRRIDQLTREMTPESERGGASSAAFTQSSP